MVFSFVSCFSSPEVPFQSLLWLPFLSSSWVLSFISTFSQPHFQYLLWYVCLSPSSLSFPGLLLVTQFLLVMEHILLLLCMPDNFVGCQALWTACCVFWILWCFFTQYWTLSGAQLHYSGELGSYHDLLWPFLRVGAAWALVWGDTSVGCTHCPEHYKVSPLLLMETQTIPSCVWAPSTVQPSVFW